nr:MAG TPA: hypothetical protein [Caudoviricetes sp.]
MNAIRAPTTIPANPPIIDNPIWTHMNRLFIYIAITHLDYSKERRVNPCQKG